LIKAWDFDGGTVDGMLESEKRIRKPMQGNKMPRSNLIIEPPNWKLIN
jgi:hypothetical protein